MKDIVHTLDETIHPVEPKRRSLYDRHVAGTELPTH